MNGDEPDDFEFLLSRWSCDLNFIADLAVEQSFSDGGRRGNVAFFGVGFFGADELVLDLHLAMDIEHDDARAVAGTVFWNIAEVEHAEIAQALLELGDAGVDIALALLGELVLGVFGEVAVGAGDGNLLGKLDA